jgi:hypothetical protein
MSLTCRTVVLLSVTGRCGCIPGALLLRQAPARARRRWFLLAGGAALSLNQIKEAVMAASTFIDTIETLSRCMSESAAHLAAYLKVTEPSHAAYGVLHRLERVLLDASTQIDSVLARLTPTMRAKLAEAEHDGGEV